MKILILGGTTEARSLASHLAPRQGLDVSLSLAGRTAHPREQGVFTRTGGFGGTAGLARYMRDENISILIDATHPFASKISANAVEAASVTNVRFLALRRAAWVKGPGDTWIDVGTVTEAVAALGDASARVFLALGRNEIEAFSAAPQHSYLVRSVDPIDPPLAVPNAVYVTARGPFSEAEDCALLERHRIDIVVAKNSGGSATYGKIAACRALRIPVVLLRRPALPDVDCVETVSEALGWLDHTPTVAAMRGV